MRRSDVAHSGVAKRAKYSSLMGRLWWWFALAAGCATFNIAAADIFNVTTRLVPQIQYANDASFFPSAIDRDYLRNGRAEMELRAHGKSIAFVGTARAMYTDGSEPHYVGILNELYSDFSIAGEQFTVGKKIMSWDVGYAYRPLDLLQRDDRRALYQSTYIGVPLLAWEKFTELYAVTIAYANPGAGTASTAKDDEAFALRIYRRGDGWDGYLIARGSERSGIEAGPAWSWTLSDAFEMHGSLAYQQRVTRRTAVSTTTSSTSKALLGFTWTNSAGWSVIGEAWYDGTAPSSARWNEARRAIFDSTGLVQAYSLLAEYALQPNVRRENILLRVARTGGYWEIAGDVLHTPEDRGSLATVSFDRRWNRQRLSGAIRYFGGVSDAIYRHLPAKINAYLAWQISW